MVGDGWRWFSVVFGGLKTTVKVGRLVPSRRDRQRVEDNAPHLPAAVVILPPDVLAQCPPSSRANSPLCAGTETSLRGHIDPYVWAHRHLFVGT
jgi:hypothetical protein